MNDFLGLLQAERWALFEATAAHLDLVGEAILIAVLIGVPLGILASRSKAAERSILGLANVLQTIPSLALLGVLLILFEGQIGKPPALAALVIYSLLPIIKNTILGLKGVDRGVAEAALGMGMTAWQRLTLVELAPGGAGSPGRSPRGGRGIGRDGDDRGGHRREGLGSYIFRGISLADPRLILLGSVPAAVLALACDAALGELEGRLDPTRPRRTSLRDALAVSATLALVSLGLYGAWGELGIGKSVEHDRRRLEGLGRAGHPRAHARGPRRGPHAAQGRPPAQSGRVLDLLQRPEARRARRLCRVHRDGPDGDPQAAARE